MPELSRNELMIADFRAHHGDVGMEGKGRRLVLVHHRGILSGNDYVTPLVALRDGDDTWLIAASNGGAERHPSWYSNLRAQRDTVIETPEGEVEVEVHDLDESERDAAWALFTSALHNVESENFRGYAAATERIIPVVALRRRRDDVGDAVRLT